MKKTYQVPAVSVPEAKIFRVNYPAGSPDEHLLIENRQPIGPFDGGIRAGTGGHGGLAIWHIDDSKTANDTPGFPGQPGWPQNGNHYWVALLAADGNYDLERGVNRGKANDLYRAGHVDAITDSTIPSSNSYTGVALPPIHQNSTSDREMTFLFADVSDEPETELTDFVWAGQVQAHSPTSHAVDFSPDGKAASLLFDRLFTEASGSNALGSQVATLTLPLKPGTGAARVSLDIRGFVSVGDGTTASLLIKGMGNTVLVALPSATEGASEGTTNSPVARTLGEPMRTAKESFQARGDDVTGANFHECLEWNLEGEQALTITFVLLVEKHKAESNGGLLAIDSLDVEIAP